MKKLEKMSLANAKSKLTRKEMSNIMAGSGGGQACTWRCKNGGASGSSSSTSWTEAFSYATSYCGAGNFSLVCAG